MFSAISPCASHITKIDWVIGHCNIGSNVTMLLMYVSGGIRGVDKNMGKIKKKDELVQMCD